VFIDRALQEWIAEYTASLSAQQNTIEQPSRERHFMPNSLPAASDYNAIVV